jgi:hypothetical protein
LFKQTCGKSFLWATCVPNYVSAAASASAASAVCISSCAYKGAQSAPPYNYKKYIQQKQQKQRQQQKHG